jgi:hypothetical protein
MTIPTPKTIANQATKRYVSPAITLDRPSKKTLNKDECLAFKLRSVPTEENSTTYELTVGFFKTGTPEEFLLFLQNLRKVFVGQNVTTGPNRYAIVRRLLQGDALAAFNRAALAHGTETMEHFKSSIEDLKCHVFPRKALANQKRYMRQFLRKPREMNVREFITRLVEMNEWLEEFPPANGNNKLPMDELMDIAEYAVPAAWHRVMIMHNFDSTIHSPQEFIEFCERIEFAEGTDKAVAKPPTDSKNGKGGQFRAKSSERGITKNNPPRKRSLKWCEYHQTESHDTGECKVILAQAKRMRGQWEASKSGDTNAVRNGFKKDPMKLNKEKLNDLKKDGYNSELRDLIRKTVNEALKVEKDKASLSESNNYEEGKEQYNIENFANINLSDSDEELDTDLK